MISILIPAVLQRLCGGKAAHGVPGGPCYLHQLLDELEADFPGILPRLLDEQGGVRRHVNLYVNGEDIRFLQGLDTIVKAGDEISIVPAVAGG